METVESDQWSDKWNTTAKGYSGVNNSKGLFSLFGIECIDRTIGDSVEKPLRVLDVACGSGAVTVNVAKRIKSAGGSVDAVDISKEMLNILENQLKEDEISNVNTFCMDGENMVDLSSNQYDFAFSTFGIMLFSNKMAGLQEMHRLLKPGGQAAVITFGKDWFYYTLFEEAFKELGENPEIPEEVTKRVTIAYEADLLSMFTQAGFTSIEIHRPIKKRDVPLDDFMGFLETNPLMMIGRDVLPVEKRPLLFPTMRKQLEAKNPKYYQFEGAPILTIAKK